MLDLPSAGDARDTLHPGSFSFYGPFAAGKPSPMVPTTELISGLGLGEERDFS